MEFNGSVGTKSFSTNQDEKLEAMELLDECWFFENLLHRRARMMTRSCSDPYPDSSKNMDEIFFETQEAKKCPTNPMLISSKEVDSAAVIRSNLLRTPSLPPSINRDVDKEFIPKSPSKLTRRSSLSSSIMNEDHLSLLMASSKDSVDSSYLNSWKSIEEKTTFLDTQNASKKYYYSSPPTLINSSKEVSFVRHNLLRAPSLPPSLGGGGGGGEKESTRKLSSKLTRHASLRSADADADAVAVALPHVRVPKHLNQSTPGIPRHRAARRESRAQNNVTKDREVIRRSLSFKKSSSSLNVNDLEVEEVQGFKDLGFVFDKDQVNKSLANIIPGLQDKKPIVIDNENKARRPYLSEAWLLHSSSIPIPVPPPPPPPPPPAVPKWVERKSGGDMKAQLKYWARTVASNVRQEC